MSCDLSINSVQDNKFSQCITFEIAGTRKVLVQTSVGHKRKLSTYRSRNDIYLKKHKVINQKNSGFNQNYTKITMALEGKEVDILGVSSDSEEETVNDESMDIKGFDHLPSEIMEDNSEIVHNISEEFKTFKEKAMDKLLNTNLLKDLVNLLSDSGQLRDFPDLLEHIREKSIPCTNIAFVLLLERAHFQSCMNTVGMRYSELTKKFWSIVYRLCKGIGLKFFSREKNWGQVVTKKSRKSRYHPADSKINFTVPDEKVLRDYNKILPKVIPPGKIYKWLNLLSGKKDIIMMGDSKLVAKGLKMNFEGDINLFGHETNPNLDKLIFELKSKLEFVAKSSLNFLKSNDHDKLAILQDLGNVITDLISRVEVFQKSESKKLQSYINCQQRNNNNFPEKAISSCKTNMYTASLWVKKALRINMNLFQMASSIHGNSHTFRSCQVIESKEISNLRQLHDADYVISNVSPLDHSHLFKRYSYVW